MYCGMAGTGYAPSPREASDTPRMIEHPRPFYIRPYSLLAEALRPYPETDSLEKMS
jgi:hypothetical protein